MNQADTRNGTRWRHALAGALLLAAGISITIIAWDYPTGGIVQMGPGYMPKAIGIALSAMAIAVIFSDLRDGESGGRLPIQWRALIFISASVLVFAVMLNRAGLVPAMFVALILAMLADGRSPALGVLVYALIVTALCWALFIPLLGLPVSAFWR